MHNLHRILPERVIDMDRPFHNHAKKLAGIDKQHDGALATFYSGKLMDGCVSCHQVYAKKRFPGFVEIGEVKHDH